jgi:intergrase/recombinase
MRRKKKGATTIKKKHAPKSPLAAKIRRNRLVKALFNGECLKDVAISTGLSPKTAGSQATNILKHPQALKTFIRYMEENGISDDFLAAKIYNLINAKKTEFFQKDGVVTDQREVEAIETQRKTLELATKLKGHLKERSAGDIIINLMQMVVQAVRNEEEE